MTIGEKSDLTFGGHGKAMAFLDRYLLDPTLATNSIS
jgi:hypothetical protein